MNRDTRLVTLALLLWGFGEGLFLYVQPLYMEQLGATPVQIGGLLSAMSVVSAVTFLPAGALADRLPRKLVMWGGWALGLMAVLMIGLARTWQGLIPGLLLYSLSAYCMPVINAYLAHVVGGYNMERTFTTVFAGYAAGGLISPTVGGWLAGATTMRTVYFAAAALFAISMLVVMWVSPQPVSPRVKQGPGWRSLLNRRFLHFAALTWLAFVAMYSGFPLTPNFLADVRGWGVAQIGTLGSFQALGTMLLTLLLGRLADGQRTRGLLVGQMLVWGSALLLLLTGVFPALALAYLLRGAYQGCRSLIQARATTLGGETERGLLLGAAEVVIAAAQIVAPYLAGWLYADDPAYPFVASLALIPVALLLAVIGMPR
ncbi:MAG: MFS transporter [Chloroflexota bacterium]|nr:MFS transporter [Chloroflexota bacterium]